MSKTSTMKKRRAIKKWQKANRAEADHQWHIWHLDYAAYLKKNQN